MLTVLSGCGPEHIIDIDLDARLQPRWADESHPSVEDYLLEKSATLSGETIADLNHFSPTFKGDVAQKSSFGRIFTRVSSKRLPKYVPEGDFQSFREALRSQVDQCEKSEEKSQGYLWKIGKRKVYRKQWCLETGREFLRLAEAHDHFEAYWEEVKTEFEWYRSKGDEGLDFTGYYLPVLSASVEKDDEFHYPIYFRPRDLIRKKVNGQARWYRVLPDGSTKIYYSRKQIDEHGALSGFGLEIGYVRDPLEAYFLHIQGSGILDFRDSKSGLKGGRVWVNYDGQNGRRYESLIDIFKKEGVPERYYSLEGIRAYFSEHPENKDRLLTQNPSYVFFRATGRRNAIGASGAALTAGHSIAVDPRAYPLGGVVLFVSRRPKDLDNYTFSRSLTSMMRYSRMALSQDTGGAIKGPGRIDIFWGEGQFAEQVAGIPKQRGEIYVALIPRDGEPEEVVKTPKKAHKEKAKKDEDEDDEGGLFRFIKKKIFGKK